MADTLSSEREQSKEQQATEPRKAHATTIAALIAAIVGAIGLLFSGYQWYRNREVERNTRLDIRMDSAIAMLTDNADSKQLAAVISLRQLVDASHSREKPIVLALLNQLAIDDSPRVRNTIVNVIRDIFAKTTVDQMRGHTAAAIDINRALVAEAGLLRNRRNSPRDAPQGAEARAAALAEVIVAAIRLGAHPNDLARTYLFGVDLRKVDLSQTNFEQAVLSWARFDEAILGEANFTFAYLDGTSFVRASARKAIFNQRGRWDSVSQDQTITTYVDVPSLSDDSRLFIRGPRFDCADLTDASFDGHVLFVCSRGTEPTRISITTSFRGAHLRNTHFKGAVVYGLGRNAQDMCDPRIFTNCGLGTSGNTKVAFFQAEFASDEKEPWRSARSSRNLDASAMLPYDRSFANWAVQFAGAEWANADLPDALREIFARHPPPLHWPWPCGRP